MIGCVGYCFASPEDTRILLSRNSELSVVRGVTLPYSNLVFNDKLNVCGNIVTCELLKIEAYG